MLKWQANLSFVQADEPDTRVTVYRQLPDGLLFEPGPLNAERFFSELFDRTAGGSVESKNQLPFGILVSGLSVQGADRSFSGRRFRFVERQDVEPAAIYQRYQLPPEQRTDPLSEQRTGPPRICGAPLSFVLAVAGVVPLELVVDLRRPIPDRVASLAAIDALRYE